MNHSAASLLQQAQVLERSGRLDEARGLLDQCLAATPGNVVAHYRRGIIAHRQGRLAAAEADLRQASTLDPRQPAFPYTLGLVLQDLGQAEAAVAAYREALRRQPALPEGWNNLGLALLDLKDFDAAVQALRQALSLRPDYPAARGNLATALCAAADALAGRNQAEAARQQFREALVVAPGHLSATLGAALTLQPVPASRTALEQERARYSTALDTLPSLSGPLTEQALQALARCNFLLAYQGEDDRPLQQRYGDWLTTELARLCPQWQQPLPPRLRNGRRLRVGFVSSFFRTCTAGLYFRHWITDLDPQRFEVHVFHLAQQRDATTERIQQAAHRFVPLTGPLDGIAETIRAAEPDVLIYPELGMDGRTFLLAALRLAPLQCAAWGHPVTSGLPHVDVFFSAETMEPPEATTHYRETLVTLPGIGTRYPRPAVPQDGERARFGLPQGATLYLFPQSPFKAHPDNDALLARVLQDDPAGLLVLFEGQTAESTAALLARLNRAGIPAERIRVLPAMPHPDYLRVCRLCDLMLDSLHWSGGNTSLDALAAGLPVVTLPGRFMRGRQSAAMLRLIGLPELIARDADDYVALATHLGRNPARRAALRRHILAAAPTLFDRSDAIERLQQWLLDAPAGGRTGA